MVLGSVSSTYLLVTYASHFSNRSEMIYVVKWSEHNREHEKGFMLHQSAVGFLKALLLISHCWDAKIIKRNGYRPDR